jgi:iron complex transport system substrate-binding protein
MNRTIRLGATPKRIVSLVPSQTELLNDLGLGERVVGITKFCIHPKEWYRSKVRVGGTKNVDVEKVKALQSDLIIGNKEENSKEDIEALEKIAPVWMSDIFTLDDSLEMINQLGSVLNVEKESKALIDVIGSEFEKLSDFISGDKPKNVAYFIWKNPDMIAGKQTFIDDMLSRCGFQNYTSDNRYPTFQVEEDKSLDYIFLSSEPFPFKEKEVLEFQKKYPQSKVMVVDGEYFSWYGSRLNKAPNYFKQLIGEINNLSSFNKN